ncbi:uncharacterized protein CLAFUR5_06645 [Fulvia fulva]|uniref:Uncharacterized protein n=1 Tax=Passalora fulva TaxID=5499 RepID=A0A9Q8PAM7_PASFU|nr:uncharacterized protein CLAFUR5_06645 [Fulvia fulva]KAK4621356.1 hypothetical protein CLAFUR4_06505 [Fulvia fulva]UJO18967.1 hypothetical protein CLAFUR5_06645 [Fulvia fulva]
MSYYPTYYMNGQSAPDAPSPDYLQYQAALRRQFEASTRPPTPYAPACSHPGYPQWPPRRGRHPDDWQSLSQIPVPFQPPDTAGIARQPGYGSWRQHPRGRCNHWNPRWHAHGSYGYQSMNDAFTPAPYAVGLSGPRRPPPDPPVPLLPRPLPPPSGPRPPSQPKPPPRPKPGPKQQHSRQARVCDYFSPSVATDSDSGSEFSKAPAGVVSAQVPKTISVGIDTHQSRAPKHATAHVHQSRSEGTRTPTQIDYEGQDSGYHNETTSIKDWTPNCQAPRSTSAGQYEAQPGGVELQTKNSPWCFACKPRNKLPHRYPYRDFAGYAGVQRNPMTGRCGVVSEGDYAAVIAQQQAGLPQAGRYDFQVPRSPN